MGARILAVVALLALLLGSGPARAEDPGAKALRGLAAIGTGVLEVPGNMVLESDIRGPGVGIPLGFVKGLAMIVVRELVGVYELVSAPFPAPAGYRPIIRPEYPWDYFDPTERARLVRRGGELGR
ncbi:MAG TPA: exosortase system-associated protein, TIGR04073 family [Candidatus Binatia bacterium]|nr:exosortase system-associated protein, TIGR04073 family [Candidatus Binatia bacterium]